MHSAQKLISTSSYSQNTVYQISTSYLKWFWDITSARRSDGQTEVVKGNNFVINGSIKKKRKKKNWSAYFSYRKYILSFKVLHKLVSTIQYALNFHKKREITLAIFCAFHPKVNQHIFIWSRHCIPNINFISQMFLTISRPQESITEFS